MLLSLEYTAEQAMRQSYFRQGGQGNRELLNSNESIQHLTVKGDLGR